MRADTLQRNALRSSAFEKLPPFPQEIKMNVKASGQCVYKIFKRRLPVATLLLCCVLSCVAQARPESSALIADKAVPTVDAKAARYVIGVGDVLDINVWKEPDLSLTAVAVRPDGMISFPLIGELKVGGSTPLQLHDELVALLGRYLSVARVTVTVAEIKSKLVYVTGEIAKPGVYSLTAPSDVLQLIIRAGGPTPFARNKPIAVLRMVDGKQSRILVNYKKLLRGEYLEQNIYLLPGDTVVVP